MTRKEILNMLSLLSPNIDLKTLIVELIVVDPIQSKRDFWEAYIICYDWEKFIDDWEPEPKMQDKIWRNARQLSLKLKHAVIYVKHREYEDEFDRRIFGTITDVSLTKLFQVYCSAIATISAQTQIHFKKSPKRKR